MAWTQIEQINGRRVVVVCPKRPYRIPAYLQECMDCSYMHERTATHVHCGYTSQAAPTATRKTRKATT